MVLSLSLGTIHIILDGRASALPGTHTIIVGQLFGLIHFILCRFVYAYLCLVRFSLRIVPQTQFDHNLVGSCLFVASDLPFKSHILQ
jgi:hypothetical protein